MANGELLAKNVDASPSGRSGGAEPAPASPSPLASAGKSAWWPLALRAAGLLGLLGALSAVGIASVAWTGGSVAVARPVTSAEVLEPPTAAAAAEPDAGSDGGAGHGLTSDGKVILNLASADELRRLPGIGKRRAERIVALRERLKRFRHVSDLLRIRGLGARAVRRIEPHVVLDPPVVHDVASDAGATHATFEP